MHFHILGVGSIGCLLAHHLRRVLPASHSISLIHKTLQDRQRLIERGSISVERAGLSTETKGYHHEIFNRESNETSPVDNITSPIPSILPPTETIVSDPKKVPIQSLLVTLKAHQTLPAIKALLPRLSSTSTIVLLQNGMGIYDDLLNEVFLNPSQRPHIVLASNTHGAFASNHHEVVHAGVGTIEFGIAPDPQGRDFEAGLYDSRVEPKERRLRLTDISSPNDSEADRYSSLRASMAALLLLEPLHTSWKSFYDVQVTLRRKLTVNAVINPLTALLDCRNGDLFEHAPARALLSQVCDEASEVYMAQMAAETQGWLQELQSEGHSAQDFNLPPFPSPLLSESLQHEVVRVADITRRNISSTLQDVRRGRKTEVGHISGYIVGLGQRYGVKTPINSTLLNLIKLKTSLPINII